VALMVEKGGACRDLVGKLRPRHKWQNNIKIGLQKRVRKDVD
jgi:hypothetical protein